MELKKKILFIAFIAVLIVPGCSLIHYLSVSKKSSENLHMANQYLYEISGDSNYSYQISRDLLDSLSEYTYAINTYKLQHGTKASPVQMRMFDNSGVFLYGWSQCFGSIKRLGLLDNIPFKSDSHLPVNMDLSFQKDLELYDIDAQEQEHILNLIKEYDYVIVVYWAMWAGWYSKDTIKRLYKYVDSNDEYSILILKLNTSP